MKRILLALFITIISIGALGACDAGGFLESIWNEADNFFNGSENKSSSSTPSSSSSVVQSSTSSIPTSTDSTPISSIPEESSRPEHASFYWVFNFKSEEVKLNDFETDTEFMPGYKLYTKTLGSISLGNTKYKEFLKRPYEDEKLAYLYSDLVLGNLVIGYRENRLVSIVGSEISNEYRTYLEAGVSNYLAELVCNKIGESFYYQHIITFTYLGTNFYFQGIGTITP